MSKNSATLEDSILSSSFIALVLSSSGWALLEASLLLMHVGIRGHVLGTLLGLVLVLLSLKHFSRFRRKPAEDIGSGRPGRRSISGMDTGWALSLLSIGGLIGFSVLYEGTLVLATLTSILCFVPWMRIPFCRQHFFAAGTSIWIGTALALYVGHRSIAPVSLALAPWVLWTFTCFSLLLRAEKLWRVERSVKSTADASEPQLIPD